MIAVTAASGQFGHIVIETLKKKVDPSQIVAIARNASKAADLGVEVRQAAYADPAALQAALKGVEKVLLVSGLSPERVKEHTNVVDAAKANGVKSIVYTSILNAERWTIPTFRQHLETEEMIRKSGLAFTFLRNGWYTENNTMGLNQSVAHGAVVGAAGEGRIAWATRRDFAEAAAALLATDGHEGKIYELAGDQAHTLSELAAEASRHSGKPVAYNNLSKADYSALLVSFGLPAPVAESLAATDAEAVPAGLLNTDSKDLSRLIGRPTSTLSDAVAAAFELDDRS